MPGWKTEHRAVTDTFYRGDFDKAKRFTGENALARPLIDALKKDGLHLILATNPLFPRDGVETRPALDRPFHGGFRACHLV